MAERAYDGNLGKTVTLEDLQLPGGVTVADPLRVDLELREIFQRARHGNPLEAGRDGNFDGTVIPITTPSSVDTELAVAHNLGRVPEAIQQVVAARAGYSFVGTLYCTRDADDTYLYLAVRDSIDTNRKLALQVF